MLYWGTGIVLQKIVVFFIFMIGTLGCGQDLVPDYLDGIVEIREGTSWIEIDLGSAGKSFWWKQRIEGYSPQLKMNFQRKAKCQLDPKRSIKQ